MLQSIDQFLRLVTEGERPSPKQLAQALDRLAVAYHDAEATDAEAGEDECIREPPRGDYRLLTQQLRQRFPDYAVYSVGDLVDLDECLTCDPIDDLADIVLDLREVVWRHANVGVPDGIWHFRYLFEIHWGRHLRQLSRYLHGRQFYG